MTEPLAQGAGGVGPAQRVGRQQHGDELRFPFQPVGDLVLEIAAQQPIGGDDQPSDRDRDEQAHRDEQPGGELHARRRAPPPPPLMPPPRDSGRRNR